MARLAAERKATEWVASRLKGGCVHLVLQDGSSVTLTPDQPAFPVENFFMQAVTLRDPNLDVTGLSNLRLCRRLTDITLAVSANTAAVRQLPAHPTVRHLGLDLSSVDDERFQLLARWPNLQSLDLLGCQNITDQGLTSLPHLAGPLQWWFSGS